MKQTQAAFRRAKYVEEAGIARGPIFALDLCEDLIKELQLLEDCTQVLSGSRERSGQSIGDGESAQMSRLQSLLISRGAVNTLAL